MEKNNNNDAAAAGLQIKIASHPVCNELVGCLYGNKYTGMVQISFFGKADACCII